MRCAVYDLRTSPPSFDFLGFVVQALYHGARRVYFINGVCESKLSFYSEAEQAERVKTILIPICELYGLPYEFGPEDRTLDAAWPPFYRAGKQMYGYTFGWMKSITKPEPIMPTAEALAQAAQELRRTSGIVVHLRSGRNIPGRNSGRDWETWAKEHDAYVVRDHREQPIPLALRVAFHELATLNIGAAAGHMQISTFSHRPYVVMKFLSNAGISTTQQWHKSQGFLPGDQFPWAGKNQRLVWDGRDDYEAIESAYHYWCVATDNAVACKVN